MGIGPTFIASPPGPGATVRERLSILLVMLAACASPPPPVAIIHDNSAATGQRSGDTVAVTLRPVRAMWYPETATDPGAEVWAIAPDGGTPVIPGPLLRGDARTVFRVTIHNPRGDSTLFATGFGSRPGGGDTIRIAPRRDTTVVFAAGAPGSYFYSLAWGRSADEFLPADVSLLSGALIVDEAAAPTNERVFLISSWFARVDSALGPPFVTRDWLVINGRSFPYNTGIAMQQGDTMQWRWINASDDAHPIHLHGDHFRVIRRGTMTADSAYWNQEVVTQLMLPGTTFTARYVPTEPGNWTLHCHFAFHTSHFLSTEQVPEPEDPGDPHGTDHTYRGMKGMLLPIQVTPREGGPRRPGEVAGARPIRIVAQGRPAVYRDRIEGMAFIQTNGADPAADSLTIPSAPLVLYRNHPVAITVVNRMRAATAVHWHGIELPSWSDGVPGWSGGLPDVAPAIQPGDSFTARFAPPRAGTFIYHAHSNELHQIGSGLYGALLVVDSASWNPARERIVIVGGDGFFSEGARVNGSLTPAPITIPADVPIRFRLIDIAIDFRVLMQLQRTDNTAVAWRQLAKDGAELPLERQVTDTLPWVSAPGETADYEITLPRGEYLLMVRQFRPGWVVPVRIVVGR